jgi:hypothetical protein
LPLFEVFAKRRDLAVFGVSLRGHSVLEQASVTDADEAGYFVIFLYSERSKSTEFPVF